MSNLTKKSRTLTGTVVSDKMQKTVVIKISRLKMHAKYKKQFKTSAKYKAHDQNNEYHVGDRVVIQETRPLSHGKRWIVTGKLSSQSLKSKV